MRTVRALPSKRAEGGELQTFLLPTRDEAAKLEQRQSPLLPHMLFNSFSRPPQPRCVLWLLELCAVFWQQVRICEHKSEKNTSTCSVVRSPLSSRVLVGKCSAGAARVRCETCEQPALPELGARSRRARHRRHQFPSLNTTSFERWCSWRSRPISKCADRARTL